MSRARPARPSARTGRPPRARWPLARSGERGRRGRAALRDRLRRQVGGVRRAGRRAGRARGRQGRGRRRATLDDEIDDLRSTLKENISVGRVRRLVAEGGQVVDTYLHLQAGRGVNAVGVELEGGTDELAHDIAVHIAFAKPAYLSRDDVPADEVEAERATLETISRNEGKPEAALRQDRRRPHERVVQGARAPRSVLCPRTRSRHRGHARLGTRRGFRPGRRRRLTRSRVVGESRRIVLKMSGEALASAASDETIDTAIVERMAKEMAEAMDAGGLELAVVVGGGNIWRGTTGESSGMDRATSDYMGMLGTVINALALQDALEQPGPADPGADRPLDGRGGRALHPAAGHPPPREGPHRDLRRRHGKPVLHDRHPRCTPSGRNRRRAAVQGHPLGRRRRLQRRSQAPSGRHPLRRDLLHGRDQPRPAGHGPDRHHLLQGQQSAHPGVRPHDPGEHRSSAER